MSNGIDWAKQDEKKKLSEIVAPNAAPTSIDIGKAWNRYIESYKFAGKPDLYKASYAKRKTLKLLHGSNPMDRLTVGHLTRLFVALKRNLALTTASSIRSEFVQMIRFNKTGDVSRMTPRPPEDGAPVSLKIRPAKIELLAALLSPSRGGRFADAKIDIKRQALECAPGEFRIIDATARMKADEKERDAFVSAINGMFFRDKMAWVIRWSSIEKVFFVVRKEHLNAARGVKK